MDDTGPRNEEALKLLEIFKSGVLGVVSSVNAEGNPQAALVNYAITENLEIIFETVKSSRKYKNIKSHPRIAFVLYLGNQTTVQYEGDARELGDEDSELKNIYFSRNPDAKRWQKPEEQTYFVVKPTWIRYSNFARDPEEIVEANL